MESFVTSPRTNLLSLPDELLRDIFNDVYTNWKDVEASSWRSLLPPTVPLCRRLSGVQREALYKNVKIEATFCLRQFNKFFETILAQPQLATFVTSFSFEVWKSATPDYSKQLKVTDESLRLCFRQFRNLETLGFLHDAVSEFPQLLSLFSPSILSPKCTSIDLSLYHSAVGSLDTLPLNLETLKVTFLGGSADPFPLTKASTISLLTLDTLSHLTLARPEIDIDSSAFLDLIIQQIPVASNVTTLSIFTPLSDRRRSSWFQQPSVPAHESHISKFPNLKTLTLGGGTISNSQTFVDDLRKLPLETLVLEKGETIPLEYLVALVSSSTRHLTLRTLTISFLLNNGKMGTRISTVALPFDQVHLDTDDVEDDLMTDDFDFPTWPQDCKPAALIALQDNGKQNGIRVDGEVFEAIKIQAA
ncbi:uncharacterized protein JCM6883_002613 [Sporobolomyces salmoneus]|uniref:uncharacterized protein n=1 Tax=Sporobolomyces salmoneus TaxID=183962 RepID=UPI003172538C